MIKKKFKKFLTSWGAINENIIKMDINTFGKIITILGLYEISRDKNICKERRVLSEFKQLRKHYDGISMVRLITELKLLDLMESKELMAP